MTAPVQPAPAAGSGERSPHPGGALDRLATLLATGFGSGRSPLIPGTTGTLAAIPVHILLAWLGGRIGGAFGWLLFPAFAVAFVPLAIWSADRMCRRLGQKDPGVIVVDEWAGYFITVMLHDLRWTTVLAGFLVFRILDVVKPFPARSFESLPGGLGVVADDVMAGVYGNIALWLLLVPLMGLLP